MKVVLASANPGKLREFQELFKGLQIELVSQLELGVPSCPEPHSTFVENALEKARHTARLTGCAALADDSGLCVDALGGAPGVQSARFAETIGFQEAGITQTDTLNNRALVHALKKAHVMGSKALNETPSFYAYYVCVLVFMRHHNDPQPLIAQAIWQGSMITEPRGDYGFGYDSYFFVSAQGMTVAQMPNALKNSLSHRGQAMRSLLSQLEAAQIG